MKRAFGVALLLLASCAGPQAPDQPLPNLHTVAPGVLSGAVPEGDASFRELARLGVRTVISVDGMKPDVEGARRHGLRYVHLPIGYDGIPADRALELGKALSELPGPVYLHCHHGKHRGPAAAAVACVVAGKLDNDQAVQVMKSMGTGEQYRGLWSSARGARAAESGVLERLHVDYREVAPIPPLTEAMVALDEAFDRLERCRKAGWSTPPGHPDVDPPHEALRAREILTEIQRTEDCKGRPADFQDWIETGRRAAAELERRLREPSGEPKAAFEALRKTCADCHKPYRNAPKK